MSESICGYVLVHAVIAEPSKECTGVANQLLEKQSEATEGKAAAEKVIAVSA